MKIKQYLLLLSLIIFFTLGFSVPAETAGLATNLNGKILLQVEESGEAWYVYPNDLQRYYLGRPADAFNVMRNLGLGISENDFNNLNGVGTNSLSGKIILRVQANGEAYYVNTYDLRLYYLGRPADAFGVMRSLGLGITNDSLEQIVISPQSVTLPSNTQTLVVPTVNEQAPSNTNYSNCGDGVIDQEEECDGETYCSQNCKIVSQYNKVPYTASGNYIDYEVAVGDKVPIDAQLNIRIDSIDIDQSTNYGSRVNYSIWGKDNANACRLISTSGEFWTELADYKFREFTNAFVELVSVTENKVNLRVHKGRVARSRCEEMAGWKKNVACSFYPTSETYYIQNDKFRIYLNNSHNKEYAHYIIDALSNCHSEITEKISLISSVTPFGDRWQIYPMIAGGGGFSADYQRVSIPVDILSYNPSSMKNLFAEIKGGVCPFEKSYIAHELTHLLFSNTMLQGVYDDATKAEFSDSSRPGSMKLAEGLANFIPYYISKENQSSSAGYNYKINNTSVCGKNSLINHNNKFSGATSEQLQYSEILSGKGYKSNHYQAGFCFFKRVEDDCGEIALNYLFNQQLQYNGSIQAQSTIFTQLAQFCGETKIKNIMSDFGFDHELLQMQQQNPRGGFQNNPNMLGCYN